jgi:hypothetical protein
MSKAYFLIFSSIIGIASAIGFFSVFSYYLKKAYWALIPLNKKKELDKRINNWWESSISKKPVANFRLSLESIISVFSSDNKPNITKILFFSYLFTLSSLVVGYFFSNIGNYFSIYWNFPVDFVNNIQIQNAGGIVNADPIKLAEFRNYISINEKSDFYSNLIYFALAVLNFWMCFKNWKKENDYKMIYSFLIITELLTLALKPITYFTDEIAGRLETPTKDYFFVVLLNILILLILHKEIFKIRALKTSSIWFISILGINFVVWNMLSFNSSEYIFDAFFIDGICNRYLALYLINFLFDYFTIRLIFENSSYVHKKTVSSLIYYLFICILIALIAAVLTYLVHTFYIFLIQNAIPEFSLQPRHLSQMNYFNYLVSTTVTQFVDGTYIYFFYAISSFLPLMIFLLYSIILILTRTFRKLSSHFVFYIYIISNPANISIVPFYLISLFISFLVFIGTTHVAYITFLGFYK